MLNHCPHQPHIRLSWSRCRAHAGVCVLRGHWLGSLKAPRGALEQGKPAGPKATAEGVEGTCGVDTGEETQGLGERQRCDGWTGGGQIPRAL